MFEQTNSTVLFETVLLVIEKDIAKVYLNRPERLNAINPQLIDDLCDALDHSTKKGVKALILMGKGRAFCSGHDLKQDQSLNSFKESYRMFQRQQDVTRKIRQAPYPVIAAVHGYALGAGCELALGCDLIIAAREAKFGFPEVRVGLSVTGGITHLLPMAIGLAKAKELVFFGKHITAIEADSLGLINKVVEEADLEHEAFNMANILSGFPEEALARAKRALDRGSQLEMESALEMELEHVIVTSNSADALHAAEKFKRKN